MKNTHGLLVRPHVLIGLCVAAAAGAVTWETSPTVVSGVLPAALMEEAPSAGAIAVAGQITYKDPVTGKLGPRPANVPPVVLDPEQMRQYSTSSEGLVEERSPVDQKAILLRLQGRFQHGMMAHLDSENHLNTVCATDVARAGTQASERSR